MKTVPGGGNSQGSDAGQGGDGFGELQGPEVGLGFRVASHALDFSLETV